MSNKDRINKISGVIALGMLAVIIFGYLTGNDSVFGIPNNMAIYAVMPAGMVWFGTRKNGCGSCNQTS